MKKYISIVVLVLFSKVLTGQIIVNQANSLNVQKDLYVGGNGSSAVDTANTKFKFKKNGNMYLKPNTPVVGYVLTAADTNGRTTWQAASGGWSLTGNAGTNPATDFVGTTDSVNFIIQPNVGNVGIGTNSPSFKLTVDGDFYTAKDDGLGNLYTISNNPAADQIGSVISGNYLGTPTFNSGVSIQKSLSQLFYLYANQSKGFSVYIDSLKLSLKAGVGYADALTLIENGNVGIGTSTPAAKLHVAGNTLFDGGPFNFKGSLHGLLTQDNGLDSTIDFTVSRMDSIHLLRVDKNGVYVSAESNTGKSNIIASNTGVLLLNALPNSGNVGIGTTSPVNKLQVAGGITANTTNYNDVWRLGFESQAADTTSKIDIDGGTINLTCSGPVEGVFLQASNDFGTLKIHTTGNFLINETAPFDGSVGIGTTNPAAVLDVSSTTSGVLLPRVTTTERDAFATPANGMIIYNTTTDKFQGYAGGAWVDLN